MRWYRLTVGKLQIFGGAGFRIEAGLKNITPLNIYFSVQNFETLADQVPAIVRIWGVPISAYRKLQSYSSPIYWGDKDKLTKLQQTEMMARKRKGAPIKLEAGFDFSNLNNKLGYQHFGLDKTIIAGRVASVSGNFETHDTWIQLSIAPDSVKEVNQTLSIEMGKPIANELEKVAKFYLANGVKTKMSLKVRTKIYTSTQTFSETVDSLRDLARIAKMVFGITMYYDASTNAVTFKDGDKDDTLGMNMLVKVLSPSDFLSQPECTKANGQIELTLHLNPNIRLNDKILISGVLPKAGGYWNSYDYKPNELNSNMVFQQGLYTVTQVMHNGNFYGSNVDDWSTKIIAQPEKAF